MLDDEEDLELREPDLDLDPVKQIFSFSKILPVIVLDHYLCGIQTWICSLNETQNGT